MSHKYKLMCCGWCFVKMPNGTDENGRKVYEQVRRFHDYDATKCHKGKDPEKHGPSTLLPPACAQLLALMLTAPCCGQS